MTYTPGVWDPFVTNKTSKTRTREILIYGFTGSISPVLIHIHTCTTERKDKIKKEGVVHTNLSSGNDERTTIFINIRTRFLR